MQVDPVYHKAIRIWLEAHGHVAAAASLSIELVAEWQKEGVAVAEAAAEALRLMTVLEMAQNRVLELSEAVIEPWSGSNKSI